MYVYASRADPRLTMPAVWLMLNAELRAVDARPSSGDEFRMEVLMREMEDMVVENKLKHDAGPMQSAWARAVGSPGRARSMSLSALDMRMPRGRGVSETRR